MKICIFGAGAIGGYLGAKLAQTDAQISMIARGPHLEAMQDNGLTLMEVLWPKPGEACLRKR